MDEILQNTENITVRTLFIERYNTCYKPFMWIKLMLTEKPGLIQLSYFEKDEIESQLLRSYLGHVQTS